ncbi:MAG TPA: radical SAM protein [Prolixibacteraceae bacterium]|nr:radical SAM protein [Prolixibacteraceae bacterium]
MSDQRKSVTTDKWILDHRGTKNPVDPFKPYAWLVEKERQPSGKAEDTGTIFLTNMECPFHCLMCDLWKNTTDRPVPVGAIPAQIEWALEQMPQVKHLKLYNSGSFFDDRAIPVADYPKIASLLTGFETVIIESHPKFIDGSCLQFRNMLHSDLQVAIGLETVHPEILRKLNKHVTIDNFSDSVKFLTRNGIRSRAFILLRPPYLTEAEGIVWAQKSIDFAFSAGVECCIVIPVRAGNGAMDELMKSGDFHLPKIKSLESVLEYGINLNAGRVFADVWDLGLFSTCPDCLEQRINRINAMNLNQEIVFREKCSCETMEI